MSKKLLVFSCAVLLMGGLVFDSVAQTISSVVVTNINNAASPLCTGQPVRVSFTATGFAAGTTFTVQLSNSAGSFASPVNLGTGTSSPITTGDIPTSTPDGTAYRIRVIAGAVSNQSVALTINATPTAPPTTTTPVNLCQNQSTGPLSATPTTGNTVQWYAADNSTAISPPTPNTNVSSNTTYTFFVTQRNAAGCEYAPRTQVTVNVSVVPAPTVPSATITYCQNETATPLTATGSNLKWYTSATGGTGSTVAPTPSTATPGTTNFWVSQTVGTCESFSRAQISVTVNPRPTTAPTTTTNPNFCQNQTISPLSATPSTGNTIRWYAADNSTVILAPTPNTNVSSTTNYTYFVTQVTSSGCEFLPRTQVTATVNVTPVPQFTVPLPVLACQNQSTPALSNYVTAAANSTLLWYGTLSSGGTASTTAPTPSTATLGQTTYFVTQRNNTTNCESMPRTGIIVQVNPVPTAPAVVSPVNICLNATSSPLSATASAGATLLWWGTNATGGSSSSTPPTPPTNTTGTTTYYVSQQSANCESSRAPINVVVNPLPSAPTVTAATILYCRNDAATALTATPATGNTLRWYVGNSTIGQTGAPTPNTNVTATTITNYSVSQVTPTPANCEGPTTPITVTVYVAPAPTVTSPVTYCQNAPATPLTATTSTGATVQWYTVPTGGTGSSTAPTPSTASAGNTNFYVSQTLFATTSFAGCESPRSNINVVVNPLPTAPAVTNPAPYCQTYPSVPLTPNASGTNLRWYGTNATGGTASTTAPTPSTATPGTTNFYVSQTNNFSCEGPRAAITVTVNPTPGAPGVAALTYCQNQNVVPLTASAETNNTLRWYGNNATGGTASTSAPIPPTTTPGQSDFYVSQVNSFSCESPRAALRVTINPTPSTPTVSPVVYCATENAQPLTAGGSNIRWYTEPTGGTGATNAPTPSTNNPGNSPITTNFYVTQTNNFNCESPRATLPVTVKPLPPVPNVSKQEYLLCQFDPSVELDAKLQGTGQSLLWFLPNNTTSTNAPVITTQNGFEGTFAVLQVLEGCRGPRTEIRVNVRTTPPPTVPSVPVVSCQNSTPQPLSATGTNLKWYGTNATGGTAQTTPSVPPTQTPGNYQFYVTQTGTNGCESPRAQITVIIQPLPSATIIGEGTITQGQSANLTIHFTGQGPWTYTLSNGLTLTTNQNPVNISVSPLETTVYTVTKITNSCGEGSPAGSATINVRVATIDVGTPSVTTLCANTSFTIPYFSSDFFPSNTAFRVQISRTTDDAGFQTIETEGNSSPLRATIPRTTPGGVYFVRVVGVASNFTVRGKISSTQITVRELPTATITGPSNVFANEDARLSIALTGENPWTVVYRDSLARKDTTIQTANTPYQFSVRPGRTNTYSIVSISNACGNGPATSRLVLNVVPVLSVAPNQSGEWFLMYPVPLQSRCTIEIRSNSTDPVMMTFFDDMGRVVLEQQTTNQRNELDLSALQPGTYYVNARQKDKIARQKIVKIQ